MYIITAIPLDYIPKEAGETFTFFSAQLLQKGALIKANIKKRSVKLLVVAVNPLKDYKASVRKSDFVLSPISEVLWETSFLQKIHYDLARYLGSYYYESTGSYLKAIFPLKFYKQLEKINLILPAPKDENTYSKSAANLIFWQSNAFEKSLHKLINEHTGQILILCPTLTHLEYLREKLKRCFPNTPLLIYRRDNGIKDGAMFYKQFVAFPNAIIIGLQSAVLLPFFNLETIIVYEYRHRGHLSLDQHPYYSTTKVAAIWSKLTHCQLVLTAALPDIDLIHLSDRYLEAIPPNSKRQVEIVDLKSLSVELKSKIVLSPTALDQVKKALSQNKRILIFLNRKGLAHYVVCKDCGQVPHCPHCQKPLALRENGAGRELICRECGYHTEVPDICPHCHSWHLKAVGLGVEAIVKQLLENAVPSASINLISQDELENKTSLIELLAKPALITVATEIIFKPQTNPFDLTVIVSLDSLLNSTNYLASEELINCLAQLKNLTQRKIILQTFEPQNEFWRYIADEPFASFYPRELAERKMYHYPPFAHIIKITVVNKNNLAAHKKANELVNLIQSKILKMPQEKRNLFNVLGPSAGNRSSGQGVFFWEIIIKLSTDSISIRDSLLRDISGKNINIEIDPPLGI